MHCNLQKWQDNKSQKLGQRLETKETWKSNAASDSVLDPFAIKATTGQMAKLGWGLRIKW